MNANKIVLCSILLVNSACSHTPSTSGSSTSSGSSAWDAASSVFKVVAPLALGAGAGFVASKALSGDTVNVAALASSQAAGSAAAQMLSNDIETVDESSKRASASPDLARTEVEQATDYSLTNCISIDNSNSLSSFLVNNCNIKLSIRWMAAPNCTNGDCLEWVGAMSKSTISKIEGPVTFAVCKYPAGPRGWSGSGSYTCS